MARDTVSTAACAACCSKLPGIAPLAERVDRFKIDLDNLTPQEQVRDSLSHLCLYMLTLPRFLSVTSPSYALSERVQVPIPSSSVSTPPPSSPAVLLLPSTFMPVNDVSLRAAIWRVVLESSVGSTVSSPKPISPTSILSSVLFSS
jgi:hypothetical protein